MLRRAIFCVLSTVALLLCGCSTGSAASDHEIEFRGAALRYTLVNAADDGGREPTLVFVHGWASSRSFWDAQLAGLRGERQMLALDLPGHGESEDVDDEHSFDLYAEAINAVLEAASVEQAVLVGHSNGVPTVRQFWRLYPERTAGLVAVDGALREFPESTKQWKAFVVSLGSPEFLESAAGVVDQITTGMPSESERARVRETMLANPQRVLAGGIAANLRDGVWSRDRIGVPLLVINSDADYWTPEYVDYVHALSDDVEYEVIGGVSHFLMMDEPERFNRMLLDWLARRGF